MCNQSVHEWCNLMPTLENGLQCKSANSQLGIARDELLLLRLAETTMYGQQDNIKCLKDGFM